MQLLSYDFSLRHSIHCPATHAKYFFQNMIIINCEKMLKYILYIYMSKYEISFVCSEEQEEEEWSFTVNT